MPFDGPLNYTQEPVVGNTLAAIGLVPVARERAKQHKAKMIRDFAAISPAHEYMIKIGAACWYTFHFRGTFAESFDLIERSFIGNVPQPIIDIARIVAVGICEPAFSLDYFSTDPLLYVSYIDDLGRPHDDCLGIWDGDYLLAVAQRQSSGL